MSDSLVGDGPQVNKNAAVGESRKLALCGCWVHALRKFRDALPANGAVAKLYMHDIGELYAIEPRHAEGAHRGTDSGALDRGAVERAVHRCFQGVARRRVLAASGRLPVKRESHMNHAPGIGGVHIDLCARGACLLPDVTEPKGFSHDSQRSL